jgi:hypothetical protein
MIRDWKVAQDLVSQKNLGQREVREMGTRRLLWLWALACIVSFLFPEILLADGWTKVTPGPSTFMGRDLRPMCSGLTPNSEYSFWAKEGSTANLVIYLQGGGACWSPDSCVLNPTYYPDVTDQDLYQYGIFDLANQANPFRNWYFLYVPYCTADLHWGSGEWQYQVAPGMAVTIHHRGLDNFLSALSWAKKNFPRKFKKILLTGSSAGAMGTMGSFPWVKKVYPTSKLYVLGDAGIGVGPRELDAITKLHWHLESPQDLKGVSDPPRLSELWMAYADKFKNVRFAEYIAAWDDTLTWYMDRIYTDFGIAPREANFCEDFHSLLLQDLAEKQRRRNYKSYVASGNVHVILPRPQFYTESSAGISFLEWLRRMVEDSKDWENVTCTADCGRPEVCQHIWGD